MTVENYADVFTIDLRNDVAMLKKDDLHDRTWQPVVRRDTRHCLNHGPCKCRSSNTRQLGCVVLQDMEQPELSSILRKSLDMQRPIQRVKFTKAVARYAKVRDKNLLLGLICQGEPHQRSRNPPKFEDWSQCQEQDASSGIGREASLKEKNRATFFSPPENRCHLASSLKPEEREFVVDSGASMHMINKKVLNDAEMDTLTKL